MNDPIRTALKSTTLSLRITSAWMCTLHITTDFYPLPAVLQKHFGE